MYKIAILSSTRGTNLQSIIDALDEGRLTNTEIACVISNDHDCGAIRIAEMNEIPVHIISNKDINARDQDMLDVLKNYGVELVVLGGYMRFIGKKMLEAYPNRIINIHPSLLPKYPGMDLDVHAEVIKAGEKESGMTIHFIDEGVDTGVAIIQKKVELSPDETPETLKSKVQKIEKEWYPKAIQYFADGKIQVDGEKVTINE